MDSYSFSTIKIDDSSSTFTSVEIEDLMNNHAYELAEIIEQAYIDINNEIKEDGGMDE